MAISNHTIINKMLHELQPLQEKNPSRAELRKHIGNVKLMCELFLENDEVTSEAESLTRQPHSNAPDDMASRTMQSVPEMTEEEFNVMMKGKNPSNASNSTNKLEKNIQRKRKSPSDESTEHDQANGDSIFDF